MNKSLGMGTLEQVKLDLNIDSKAHTFLRKCWDSVTWGITFIWGGFGGLVIIGIWLLLILVPFLFVLNFIIRLMDIY